MCAPPRMNDTAPSLAFCVSVLHSSSKAVLSALFVHLSQVQSPTRRERRLREASNRPPFRRGAAAAAPTCPHQRNQEPYRGFQAGPQQGLRLGARCGCKGCGWVSGVVAVDAYVQQGRAYAGQSVRSETWVWGLGSGVSGLCVWAGRARSYISLWTLLVRHSSCVMYRPQIVCEFQSITASNIHFEPRPAPVCAAGNPWRKRWQYQHN